MDSSLKNTIKFLRLLETQRFKVRHYWIGFRDFKVYLTPDYALLMNPSNLIALLENLKFRRVYSDFPFPNSFLVTEETPIFTFHDSSLIDDLRSWLHLTNKFHF